MTFHTAPSNSVIAPKSGTSEEALRKDVNNDEHVYSTTRSTPTMAPLELEESASSSLTQEEERPQFRQSALHTAVGLPPPRLLVTASLLPPPLPLSPQLPRDGSGGATTTTDLDRDGNKSARAEGRSEESEIHNLTVHELVTAWEGTILQECPHRKEFHERLVQYVNAPREDLVASLLLITGSSGAGKTRLARSLQGPVEAKGGYFLAGKFNARQHVEPYVAFVSAFAEYATAVQRKGEKVVAKTRDAITQAIGDDTAVLTGMIPALEGILGHPKDESFRRSKRSGSAPDAVQRFVFVFRKFLRTIGTPKHPIVLLLDNLHWADPCSLDLLANIVMEVSNKGLIIVGTCDADVSPNSYLSRKLREIEDIAHVAISSMSLPNMGPVAVEHTVGRLLGQTKEECRTLAEIVLLQTKGKLMFIAEFLRWLEDSGFLFFDRAKGTWVCNEQDLGLAIDTKKPGQFLVDKLEQLPKDMQKILKVASCLGIHFERKLIESVLGYPVESSLSVLMQRGILRRGEQCRALSFAHDELQQSSYKLICDGERERLHLEIGQRIWRDLDHDGVDKYIFLILSQFAAARRLITDEKDRLNVAMLCLEAGKKAAKASTFRTAAFYLALGIELMGDRGWRDDYHLALALHNAGAEMEMCTANFERVEALVASVVVHARNHLDAIQAYSTRMSMLSSADRQCESLDLGIQVLQKLDEHFPSRLCNARLLSEIRAVKLLLKDKSDEQIVRIPMIEDEQKLACCQVLNIMFLSALFVRPKLSSFIALKLVKITMTYGLSNFAATAFGIYGMICISAFGDVDEGYRFGELGLKLLNKFGSMEYLPRVYAAHYGVIHSWKKPMRDALGPLWKAAQVGAQTGDVEFASLCANCYLIVLSAASRNLGVWLKTYEDIHNTMISRRQETFVHMCVAHVQSVRHFMGLTEDPLSSKGDIMDFDSEMSKEGNSHLVLFSVYACRMWIAYVFNDFELAARMAPHLTDIWSRPPSIEVTDVVFYSGLVAAANTRLGRDRRRNISLAERHLKLLRKWARTAPFNFAHKMFLVEAELASARKRNDEALEKYTYAIAMAHEFDFTLEHALANERAAQHLVRIGDKMAAEPYYRQACSSYEVWGGMAKVVRLRAEIEDIYDS